LAFHWRRARLKRSIDIPVEAVNLPRAPTVDEIFTSAFLPPADAMPKKLFSLFGGARSPGKTDLHPESNPGQVFSGSCSGPAAAPFGDGAAVCHRLVDESVGDARVRRYGDSETVANPGR
jgi:hypothetical protein